MDYRFTCLRRITNMIENSPLPIAHATGQSAASSVKFSSAITAIAKRMVLVTYIDNVSEWGLFQDFL